MTLTTERRPRGIPRRVQFVDGWALVPMPPELWFRFADRAAARGCRIPQLLDELSREAASDVCAPPCANSEPAAAEQPPEAEQRLRMIAERYFDPAAGDDMDFLAWLDGALRKPLHELAPLSGGIVSASARHVDRIGRHGA